MLGFTDTELQQVKSVLQAHYDHDVEIQLSGNRESNVDQDDISWDGPKLLWQVGGANFVVVKLSVGGYCVRFFTTPHDQFGTELEIYHDISDCIRAVITAQSQHRTSKS